MDDKIGWTDEDVMVFALQFATSDIAGAWEYFTNDVREALIESYVLGVLLVDDREHFQKSTIASLRGRLGRRLELEHGLKNPIACW